MIEKTRYLRLINKKLVREGAIYGLYNTASINR
jgi:hypothetical protein